jgi:hypothetical protein
MTQLGIRPSREEFHRLATDHTVVPVWTELLADLETPVAAYAKLVGDGQGFLLESVEHGERWSRFSFLGRDPQATLVLRNGRITVDGGVPASVPRDRGMLAALDALLAVYRAPVLPDLPPLQSGVVGYLSYDIVREVERLPSVPTDQLGLPDAVMSVIGSLVAFDHWRQRAYVIESVPVLELSGAALDAAYDNAARKALATAVELGQPLTYSPVVPPAPDDELPTVRSRCPTVRFSPLSPHDVRGTVGTNAAESHAASGSLPHRSPGFPQQRDHGRHHAVGSRTLSGRSLGPTVPTPVGNGANAATSQNHPANGTSELQNSPQCRARVADAFAHA